VPTGSNLHFQSPFVRSRIDTRLNTTVQPTLNLGDVAKLPILLPPKSERERIEALVGALDGKIELNRRMSETLEAMARTIFKDWFVDFGPTRAKMEGRAHYLTSEIWALFPGRLDSEGMPTAWNRANLGEHVSITKGKSYKSEELRNSATALVTLKSFARGGGYRPDGLKPFSGDCKPEQLVFEGDIVVAQTDVTQAADVIGRPARVISDKRFDRLVASLDVAIVRPLRLTYLDNEFLLRLMGCEAFTLHTFAHSSGTTVLHLDRTAIPSFQFALPPPELVKAFHAAVSACSALQIKNAHESDTLTTARDFLLPRMMSGEIHVKDAEKAAEAVL
jgi:type I restriction enzyme S subunit